MTKFFRQMYEKNKHKYESFLMPNYGFRPRNYSAEFSSMVNGKDVCIVGPSGQTEIPKNKVIVSIYAYFIQGDIEYISLYGSNKISYNNSTFYVVKRPAKGLPEGKHRLVNMLHYPVGHAHMLQLALHDILYYKPKSIEVINVNFYTKKYNQSIDGNELAPYKSHLLHEPMMNFYYAKQLYDRGLFYGDQDVSELLGLSVEEYVNKMDEVYD